MVTNIKDTKKVSSILFSTPSFAYITQPFTLILAFIQSDTTGLKHSIYDDVSSSDESDESYSSDTNSDYSLKSMSPVTSEEEYVASSSSNESDSDTSESHTPTTSSAIHLSTTSPQSPGSMTNQQVSTRCVSEPFSHGQTMYRLCGDNIDKTVKPRYMRSDTHKTESIHYFHSYAVANRVDFSDLSERTPPLPSVDLWQLASSLLPSPDDDATMRNNFATHVSRVLVNNIDFFKVTFDGVVDWHIKHQFYEQMSEKSDVVSFSSICILIALQLCCGAVHYSVPSILTGTTWNFAKK